MCSDRHRSFWEKHPRNRRDPQPLQADHFCHQTETQTSAPPKQLSSKIKFVGMPKDVYRPLQSSKETLLRR